ncbi:MAG: urease subunit beta [Trueperaceae bacterium]|nr:MAG: urease subunit beta [Trueperaceae bacterium]
MIPGETIVRAGDIELAPGRERRTLRVDNRGDRPIQVGSHAHLFEVNRALAFERERAYGFRLDIAAGTAVRFEPGEGREVEVVALAGERRAFGLAGLVSGSLDERREAAFAAARERGYLEPPGAGADDSVDNPGGAGSDGEASA